MKLRSIASTFILSSLLVGSGSAAVINYHFTSNASTPAPTGSEAAGVIGSSGDAWTTVSSTLGSSNTEIGGGTGLLIDLGGGLSVTLDNYYNHTGKVDNATPFGPFIQSWFSREANDGSPTLTFAGFSSTDLVNLVIFSASATNDDRGTVTVSAVGASSSSVNITAGAAQPTAYIAAPGTNSNYALFEDIQANGSGQIVVTLNSNGNFSDLNGFQLEVIPEPTTALLGGLGLLALLRRRR